MLYDPKWEVQTKPDVFSLESLIAWLETMPADKKYDWAFAESCLLGQWCAANGLAGDELFEKSIELGNFAAAPAIANAALGKLNECTFGAALERARKALHG